MSEKIRPQHLARKAILYVRRSSPYQVIHNLESQKLQYAMETRLHQLGWREIEVVDDDLGRSAAGLVTQPDSSAWWPKSAIGLACGYMAFTVTGAGAVPFGVHPGIFWPRILAAALSLSATGALMVLLGVSHPPAGATTLIVSLGIISKPRELAIIEVAVLLLVAQALAINRLAGLPYPLWSNKTSASRLEGSRQ